MRRNGKIWLYSLCVLWLFVSCAKQPTAAERMAQKRQQDSTALVEQERTLAYYDSVQQVLAPRLDELLPHFRYEKEAQYESHGHYVHRLLRTNSNVARNFIQTYVRDDSRTIVRFFYYGNRPIDIKRVVLRSDSLQTTFEGYTHAFEADGWHETLTIEADEALRCLHFIDAYQTQRISITIEGNKSRAVYYLSQTDKDALMETYRLGMAMRDMKEVEERIHGTSIQIEKYQKRLEKQERVVYVKK